MFEKILSTNLINFLIVISTLYWIYKKANLGALIQKMADDVRLSVEKSSSNAQSAISEYKATKKSLKDTPKLQEEILSSARLAASNIKEKIEEKAHSKCSEIKSGLDSACQKQGEKMKKDATNEIYSAAVNLAFEEVEKRLDENTHKKLIERAINELDKIEGSLI